MSDSVASKEMAALFLQWFIKQNIPFNAVDDSIFRYIWSRLKFEGRPPTRKQLAGPMIDDLYSAVASHITTIVKDCDHYSLTTDGWTGLQSSFWSITLRTIDKNWKMHHFRLGCIPIFASCHSADILAEEIRKTMKTLGLDPSKVASVTTDQNGAAGILLIILELPKCTALPIC